MADYERIERAIAYLVERATEQPGLEDVAAHVHLSPYHFQRLFCRWAGITPKRFLQVMTLERSKSFLTDGRSLIETSHEVGLSGSSRLHDHFVQLEAVTPGEYKHQGEGVRIQYGLHHTPFGRMFLAVTQRGVCQAGFPDDTTLDEQLADLRKTWPLSSLERCDSATGQVIEAMFENVEDRRNGPLSLHVAGTNFQIAVWRALLRIPPGTVTSYSRVAEALGRPRASRAVGHAIGANPVACLIPCHRVIRQSGAIGGYRWGIARKQVIQAWERIRLEPNRKS